jgi:hypothetical protein
MLGSHAAQQACSVGKGLKPVASRLVAASRQGAVPGAALELLQGHFKDRRTLAAQRPAAQPAAVAVVVQADHLVELLNRCRIAGAAAARWNGRKQPFWQAFRGERVEGVRSESDAAALLEVHRWTTTARFS